jgi:GTP-binding protein YchF
MRLGILGLPSSGKTTIFNALTGGGLATGAQAGGRVEVHTAISDVPDERVDALSKLFRPRKTIYAKVTYADIGGVKADAGREGLPGTLVNQLSQMDGFLQVLRAFDDPAVPHPAGSIDAGRDLAAMEAEFLLTDMLTVERKQQKLEEERQRGGRDRAAVEREIPVFQHLSEALGQERPLRTLQLTQEEERVLSGFGLLTRKPMLLVLNTGEGVPEDQAVSAAGLSSLPAGQRVLALQGKLEMEISQLAPEETQAFLEEYGITEPGRSRVIRASYDLLGLQSFFTVGEDEVRAWTIRRGATALEAADTIHSDLARGFIRAEVIGWEEMLALGSLSTARSQGKLRIEGKDYPVAEGEIVHIRFNA